MPITRSDVLTYLQGLPSNRMLFGQKVAFGFYNLEAEYQHNFVDLYTLTGQYPAIIGGEYGVLMTDEQHEEGNELLIEYWNAGGLVEINWSCDNPWTGGNYRDTTWTALADLLDPLEAVSAVWDAEVERAAGFLTELRDAGVIVLWRPFGEFNFTSSSWWDAHDDYWGEPVRIPTEYKALWQDLHDRLTNTYGLDNLIWLYSPSHYAAEWINASIFYPGDDWVDLAGFNWYSDTYVDDYKPADWADLLSFSPMPSLTESGSRLQRDGSWDAMSLLNAMDYANLRYFMVWDSWVDNMVALIDVQNSDVLLNDERVINRGDFQLGSNPTTMVVYVGPSF